MTVIVKDNLKIFISTNDDFILYSIIYYTVTFLYETLYNYTLITPLKQPLMCLNEVCSE